MCIRDSLYHPLPNDSLYSKDLGGKTKEVMGYLKDSKWNSFEIICLSLRNGWKNRRICEIETNKKANSLNMF